ncbi:putative protein kinase [Tieghemostelium lacteum]|uniref:Uncharacterized protein n=1 Tax=Tieghemostelium lacteum TaxID=361077 RepID=A0A151ZIS2_TIELA|nr:putative protein kinase [Tieghemostelium lacteum]|eukprot:KYQ93892.1 putative protein kinase [Tieghemostelium lacteum]
MNDIRRKHRSTHSSTPLKSIDVENLFASLNGLITPNNSNNSGVKFINDGKKILETLREKIKTMDSLEKLYCITQGAITILIRCLCFCGKMSINNDIIIEICTHLIDNSHESSRLFCKQILDHIYHEVECIGISDALTKIITSHPIRSIFVEDLCIPKLLEIYYKCSEQLSKFTFKPYSNIYINPLVSNGNNSNNNNNNSNISHNLYNTTNLSSNWENGTPPPLPGGISLDNLLVGVPCRNNRSKITSLRESTLTTFTTDSSTSPIETSPPLVSNNGTTPTNTTSSKVPPIINLSMSLNNNNNNSLLTPPINSLSLPTSPPINPSNPNQQPKPFIPKLVLPIRVENTAKMTRSSRRRDDTTSSTRSMIGDTKVEPTTATKELSDLATKLGETYMTTDLTALISYKQSIDSHISSSSIKRNSYAPKKLTLDNHEILSALQSKKQQQQDDQQSYINNNLYKVRCNILRTIILSTSSNVWLLQFGNNPINMLYIESILIHKGVIPSDREHLKLFYQLAGNWADYVEYIHRIRWKEVTKYMESERKSTFRKKLDLFLFRINLSITNMLDTNLLDDMEYQLCVLAEYMEHCPTRIQSSQVVDVCIESLLKVKHLVFKGKITSERMKDIHIIHYLLCVFDEIIIQNMHPPLNELLLAIFIERDDTFNFIKHYTTQILSSESIEKEFNRFYPNNPKKQSDFRCRAIKHHSVCVDMLKRNFDTTIDPNPLNQWQSHNYPQSQQSNRSDAPDYEHGIDLLKKMEYLLLPIGGVILPFLQSSPFSQHFEIKKTMLEFQSKVFMFKRNPFTKKKLYIDSYISYIYISFIKLYNNYTIDPQNLTYCKLFLDVLLAFSVNKNDKISMKFYQLRTMDFLVREINLEYEIKTNRQQFAKPSPLPFFNSTPNVLSPVIQPTNTTTTTPVISPVNTTPVGMKPKIPPLLKLPLKLGTSTTPGSTPITTTPIITPVSINNNNMINSDTTNNSSNTNTNTTTTTTTTTPIIIKPLNLQSLNSVETTPSTTTPSTAAVVNNNSIDSTPKLTSQTQINTPPININSNISPTATATTTTPITAVGVPKLPIGKIAIPKLTLPATKPIINKSEELGSKVPTNSGVLTALEQKIDPQDPKFQLVLDNPLQSLKPIQEQQQQQQQLDTDKSEPIDLLSEGQRYRIEKNNRKLYHDKDLHLTIIQLIFSLLLNSNHTLEHLYSDQFPLVAKKLNVPFILHLHISYPENEKIIPELCKKTHEMGPNYFRLLKLLFNRLYHSNLFKDLKRVAKGAYGTVYKGTLSNDEGLEIAAKLMPVPKSIHDRCVLYDIFTEILIMDTFKSDPRGCHMFDYGVDGENYWIVMKSYKCSLKEWRLKQTLPFLQQLPLYLNVFMNVLLTVQFLAEHKVNHFDIKCDNFLVHPVKKGTLDDDFWNQPTPDPNFTVCLADWGEAKVYTEDIEGYTTRNRGTEFIKSPEMLTIAYASQKTRENFDRRKKVGSNTANDVWSLGCLFFELLTGEFLFYEDDWVKFFIRVTQPGQELITPERKAKVANIPAIIEFLEYVFVRDPFYRPTLRDLLTKFNSIKPVILQQLEQLRENDSQLNPIQPKMFYNVGGDGTTYKGKDRNDGHYTPGRFFPHTYNLSNPIASKSSQPISRLGDNNQDIPIQSEAHEFPEHRHYMDNPSKITSYMYISSFHPSMNKQMLINELHITHIINCTGSPNAYPEHFEYLHLQLHDNPSQDILHSLTLAFDFIRDAIMHHGKVLICSDKGVSRAAALAIGYFMDSRSISYFEAFILIRDRRYIISPNPGFVEQLCRWGKQRRTQKGLAEWGGGEIYSKNTTQFQCLCGACIFTLLTPFDNSKFSNPKLCNCKTTTIGDSDCPNHFQGCSNFLMEMKKLHNYSSSKYVMWGYTNVTNVVGDYNRSSKEIPNNSSKKEWNLYKCKTCQFLTHAISININPGTNEKLMAIVTNLRTSPYPMK